MTRRVLVIAPHPDDEILGCGGSIINALDRGDEVRIVYLSDGEGGNPLHAPDALREIRRSEARAVAAFLGIPSGHLTFLGIPDTTISATNHASFLRLLGLLRDHRPDVVYIPHERERSFDHAQASTLAQRALDMAGSANILDGAQQPWWVPCVLAYEVWTPMESYQYSEGVEAAIDRKLHALSLYASQTAAEGNVSDFVGPLARGLSMYRAAMTIGSAREVFQVLRVGSVR